MTHTTYNTYNFFFHRKECESNNNFQTVNFSNWCQKIQDNNLFYLDQSSLHVSCFGRFHCRINQTFSASHGVEKKLGRSETTKETILHESFSLRRFCYQNNIKITKFYRFQMSNLQLTWKCGKDLLSNPSGTLFPLRACWPTHAIICEIFMKEPEGK